MKVFLVVAAWIIGTIVFVVAVCYGLWSMYGDEYKAEFKKASQEAISVANNGTDKTCYDNTLDKLKQCDGIKCTMATKAFAKVCFEEVEEQTQLCEKVPDAFDILKTGAWILAICHQNAPDNHLCDEVVQEVVTYCASVEEKPEQTSNKKFNDALPESGRVKNL